MNTVEMMVSGRLARVPVDKAELVAKKQVLIKKAKALQDTGATDEFRKVMTQLQRVSRQIGPCVQFV